MKKALPILFLFFLGFTAHAQKVDNATIRQQIEAYQNDPRGPYKDIRWFCPDGTFAIPRAETLCADMKTAVQRARYKDEVVSLAESNHIFLGQILSKTDHSDFWDAENYNSRLKQYQLEKYLRAVDDGWVLRKGQYYRGAYQIEDEEAWGIDFFNYLLAKDGPLEQQFFLVRQAVKDIPHRGDDRRTLSVRAVSKTISDAYPAFMDLRVKIHGQPEATDIQRVKDFQEKHEAKLSASLKEKFATLIADMEEVYRPLRLATLNEYLKYVPKNTPIYQSLDGYIQFFEGQTGPARLIATAEKLAEIRREILGVKSRKARLALLDISNALEEMFFLEIGQWQPESLGEAAEKTCFMGMAAMGTGHLETWEWAAIEGDLAVAKEGEMTLSELNDYLARARAVVEWGTGMVSGVYKDVVNLYGGFEPLAFGFFDDRIRSSVLLPLGQSVGELGGFLAQKAGLANQVMNLRNQSTVRGLNPGFAFGELVVVSGNADDVEVSKDKIYVFKNPPSDLKPVAGILTVSEGNMVSHVQLLARNLGIPNAVLSADNMDWLRRKNGDRVFFAVSNRGTVIMKPEGEMNVVERALFSEKKRSEERITVPIERMDLGQRKVLNMREVNAASSGKICGPKAANLGQLKLMFPEKVVEGIVLPFGIFREHMNQDMPGQSGTYWTFLNMVFQRAEDMRNRGSSDEEVEKYTLAQLELLRDAIKKMELLPSFMSDLEESFAAAFGQKIGKVPVFLRSDTNMEDLKDFTGAGLNLTIFNAVDREKIIQGIKDVWASPYTERSFKWRQRYLLNPENVFPSILIIPSVDVEYSGVVITKGIPTADGRDVTVAFSRGAGGAVDGQAAESYLLRHDQVDLLLSPAREPMYRRLPKTGGSKMLAATFEKPILNAKNRLDLRWLAYHVHQEIPQATTPDNTGPFDIELGFQNDKIWLFQIRPFVENKGAVSSAYLESITPKIDSERKVSLSTKIL